MRFALVVRMASTTFWVSAVPCQKSMAGSVAARAMSGFEARWMTTSWPSIAAAQRAGVLDVRRARYAGARRRVVRVVPLAPRREVVVHGDAGGAAVGREQVSPKWPPMKPAPPTMKNR